MSKFTEKFKDGFSVKEVEDLARKYTSEVFSILAIIIATASSCWDFFTGPKLTIFFTGLGCVIAILFPNPIEQGLKQFYSFIFKQEKSTQIILGAVQIVIALFIPFLLFGLLGLLAGTSYHYYVSHSSQMPNSGMKPPRRPFGGEGEHD